MYGNHIVNENQNQGRVEPKIVNGLDWIEYARQQKAIAVECTDVGDIKPTVIIERDGQVQAIISAPDVDKHKGLKIAAVSKVGFDPDFLTVLFDACATRVQKVQEGQEGQNPKDTIENVIEEYHKKYPNGLQAASNNDNEIINCLICHRIDRNGNIKMVILPYDYHGKDGPPFRWLAESELPYFDNSESNDLTGLIPESLRKIMSLSTDPSEIKIPGIQELYDIVAGENLEERTRFNIARAVMYILAETGCLIKDFITPLHMDWIEYIPKAISFIENIIKKGMFPNEAKEPLINCVKEHLGKKTFQDELTTLLKDHSYWLPNEMRGEEYIFATMFENIVMSPISKTDLFENKNQNIPNRIRAWNGDQTEYLGEGNYVGQTTVYFIRMPDGSIQSNQNAEIEPDPDNVPEGCSVFCSEDNPKFVLDCGDTVYGCQIWWEPVEKEKDSKHEFGGWNKEK